MSIERCTLCDEPTGRAGQGEDSLFIQTETDDCEIGPLCKECYDELKDEAEVEE